MIRCFLLFLAFVLIGSYADADDHDATLIVREHGIDTEICATTFDACQKAQKAIREGKWRSFPADTPTWCIPHPFCRDPSTECIHGFNC